MSVKPILYTIAFVCGATLAGLAAIHFVALNPAAIGPFALPIGMTPLVLLFEYSFEIPGYYFLLGALVAVPSWFLIRTHPPRSLIGRAVLLGGASLVASSVATFVLASAYYNVGMAGDIPAGWYSWVRPGCKTGDLGLILCNVGLLLMAATKSVGKSREPARA